MPETAIGFFPDIGASYFLSRLPGELGTYLGLTGARIGAADTIYTGLATHFVPARRLAEIPPRLAAGEAASAVLGTLAADPGPSELAEHRGAIDRAFAAASVEEIVHALTKEGAWGEETASVIAARSPSSLKIAVRALRSGAQLDLRRCLAMELGIAAKILKTHDFFEGIRAVLIDKDHKPHWRPARLEDVGPDSIDLFFA
jgi:enoyl-CoA hydratase